MKEFKSIMPALCAAITVVAVFMLGVWGLNSVSIHLERISCASFATESGRETKYVRLSMNRWSCMTPAKDGKWININALRDITDL